AGRRRRWGSRGTGIGDRTNRHAEGKARHRRGAGAVEPARAAGAGRGSVVPRGQPAQRFVHVLRAEARIRTLHAEKLRSSEANAPGHQPAWGGDVGCGPEGDRSEERRVGKECRTRWWGEYVNKGEGE